MLRDSGLLFLGHPVYLTLPHGPPADCSLSVTLAPPPESSWVRPCVAFTRGHFNYDSCYVFSGKSEMATLDEVQFFSRFSWWHLTTVFN